MKKGSKNFTSLFETVLWQMSCSVTQFVPSANDAATRITNTGLDNVLATFVEDCHVSAVFVGT